MTSLRMTPPAVGKPARALAWGIGSIVAFGLFGCGSAAPPEDDPTPTASSSPGANDPIWLTSREHFPAPDTDRIEYDPNQRLLTFHALPGSDQWMVKLPGEPNGRRVGPIHQLPEGIDTAHILVYYSRPGAKTSTPVTVAQIEAGRVPHTSHAIR